MAQPITKWQAFQSYYSRDNPGSSKQQTSSAWEEYKQRHGVVTKSSTKRTKTSPKKSPGSTNSASYTNVVVKSPVKILSKQSPSKKSPSKKSPSRTHMRQLLGEPTLTNLPPGIGEHISSFLPSKSVATMQRTTKRTQHITKQRLEELCREFPTKEEVANYVKDILVGSFSIHFLVLPGSLPIGTVEFTLTSEGGEIKRYANAIDQTGAEIPHQTETIAYTNVAAHCTKFVDPQTMGKIIRRRKGCNEGYSNYYDVYMVRLYIDTILRPIMRYVLEEKEIDAIVLTPLTIAIDNTFPLKPVPINEEELRIYRLAIIHLHFASNWCAARGYLSPDWNELVTRPHEVIRSRLRVVHRAYVQVKSPGGDEVLTTTNLLAYIQTQLNANKPVRVAFLSTEEIGISPKIRSVYELVLKNANSGTYTRRGYYIRSSEIVYESSSGPEAYNSILSTKLVPGVVDPITAKAIVQEKGRYENQWGDEVAPTIAGALRLTNTLQLPFRLDLPLFKSAVSLNLAFPNVWIMRDHFNQLLTLLRWFESQQTSKKVPNMTDLVVQLRMAVTLYQLVHKLGLYNE